MVGIIRSDSHHTSERNAFSNLEFPSQETLPELLKYLECIKLPNDCIDFEGVKIEIVRMMLDLIDCKELMNFGIISLKAFIQECWTGPPIKGTDFNFPFPNLLGLLEVDGEPVYSLTPYPILLIVALAVFESDSVSDLPFIAWWRLRAYFIHQKILENQTGSLYDLMMTQIDIISLPEVNDSNRLIHARYHLELGMIYHYYKLDIRAKEGFVLAQKISQFEWSVTGYLGKRTKFQTFDVSQLAVVAKSFNTNLDEAQQMPNKLDLNDDTLLEGISFTGAKETDEKLLVGSLHAIDQCILLAFW